MIQNLILFHFKTLNVEKKTHQGFLKEPQGLKDDHHENQCAKETEFPCIKSLLLCHSKCELVYSSFTQIPVWRLYSLPWSFLIMKFGWQHGTQIHNWVAHHDHWTYFLVPARTAGDTVSLSGVVILTHPVHPFSSILGLQESVRSKVFICISQAFPVFQRLDSF